MKRSRPASFDNNDSDLEDDSPYTRVTTGLATPPAWQATQYLFLNRSQEDADCSEIVRGFIPFALSSNSLGKKCVRTVDLLPKILGGGTLLDFSSPSELTGISFTSSDLHFNVPVRMTFKFELNGLPFLRQVYSFCDDSDVCDVALSHSQDLDLAILEPIEVIQSFDPNDRDRVVKLVFEPYLGYKADLFDAFSFTCSLQCREFDSDLFPSKPLVWFVLMENLQGNLDVIHYIIILGGNIPCFPYLFGKLGYALNFSL
jgi:hypothetical protein